MSTPGIQMTSNPQTCYFDRNSSLSSNPDGLSHAVNQENLRLHQIVHESKVSICSALMKMKMKQKLQFVMFPFVDENSSKKRHFKGNYTICD